MLVESDAYLVELSCYIHRNPLRAKVVKRLIDYRWSSYPAYAYGKKRPEWLKTDLILSYIGGKDGHRVYREKVQNYAGEESRVWEDFRHGLILGSEGFVERIRSLRGGVASHKEIPQQKKVLGSIDVTGVDRRALGLLGREMGGYAPGHRVRGKSKRIEILCSTPCGRWECLGMRNLGMSSGFLIGQSAISSGM